MATIKRAKKVFDTIEVYRVEGSDGEGPFIKGIKEKGLCPFKHSEYRNMPAPDLDNMKMDRGWGMPRSYLFAFPDYDTCKGFWTKSTIEHLHALRYVLACYRVTGKVVKGKSGLQVAFRKSNAERIEVKPLVSLLED